MARPAPNTVTLGKVWSAAPPLASAVIVEFEAPILPPVAGEGRLSTDIDVCRAVRRGDGGATAAADRARPGGSPLDSQLSNKIEVLFAQTPHCLVGHEWDKWRLRWRDLSAVHRHTSQLSGVLRDVCGSFFGMFYEAYAFNSDLSKWNVASVSNLDKKDGATTVCTFVVRTMLVHI